MRSCLVILVIVHSLLTSFAWAEDGRDRADRLCAKAETAERDAREAERKSEERRRFLKGRDGIAVGARPPLTADTSLLRQSVKARTMQARAILSQLRQGADSASRDKGIVPGLGQYFTQMESGISRMLQAIDVCLGNPASCSIPQIACPSIPAMPSFSNSGSADFIRRTQQAYAQAANQARQACLELNGELRGEVERLKQDSRPATTNAGSPESAASERFGEADLQLRRAESLKREASQARQDADRASGVSGYCSTNKRTKVSPDKNRSVVAALKAAGSRKGKVAPEIPLSGKVVDLKAGWDQPWEKGKALGASSVPLPKVSVEKDGKGEPAWTDDLARDVAFEMVDLVSLIPPEKAIAWYREADKQVKLTEFIQDAPMEIVKDKAKEVATEILVKASGPFGKSVEAGIKILDAVKGTTEEIGEILEDAPRVIGSGSMADAQELADRAHRVPVKFLNSLFDEVTGEINLPEQQYQYKSKWEERP